MAIALTGARLFDGDAFHDGRAVTIDGGSIVAVVPERDLPEGIPVTRLNGGVLAPGLIDVQVNGGGGVLLNDKPTIETVRIIAAAHRAHGTTGLLPTVITDDPAVTKRAISAVRQAIEENVPGVLGIHIEGPFLDPARKGAHEARFIRPMNEQDAAEIAGIACGVVIITVAPNRVPPALIAKLALAGVRVSLGHSEAIAVEVRAALDAGATAFTHLYNAMSQVTGREPGMVGTALTHSESYVGIIADGHHVHADSLRLAFAAKRRDRFMLVTDAMPSAAGGRDSFSLQGREVTRRNGRLELADGTLAGSDLTMNAAVRHAVRAAGVSLAEALRMASGVPARFMGRSHDLGAIRPGYLANLVHFDDDLNVLKTWINGQ